MLETAQLVLKQFLHHIHAESDPPVLTILEGGRSGAGVFKFELDNKFYILRLFSEMESVEGKQREATITSEVAQYNIAPQIYFVAPENQGMVMEFIHGSTTTPETFKQDSTLHYFATFLKQLHSIKILKLTADDYFSRAKRWLRKAEKRNRQFPKFFELILEDFFRIEKKYEPNDNSLIHNDLISKNILNNKGIFKLMDWPAAGYGDALWDFIDFIDFHNLEETQYTFFFNSYYENKIPNFLLERFALLRPVSSIARIIGGFAFAPDLKSKEFYEEHINDKLISFQQMISDFAYDRLSIESWQMNLIFYRHVKENLTKG